MEWTEALVVPAGLLQGHVGTGQLDQVNPLADFFLYIGSEAAAHESPLSFRQRPRALSRRRYGPPSITPQRKIRRSPRHSCRTPITSRIFPGAPCVSAMPLLPSAASPRR